MEEQQYKLLDGKAVSAQMKQEMAEEVARIKATGGKIPHLAAILVGHDGGSETYVASKVKTCNEIGFKSSLIRYEADVTEEELLRKVDELNNDPTWMVLSYSSRFRNISLNRRLSKRSTTVRM